MTASLFSIPSRARKVQLAVALALALPASVSVVSAQAPSSAPRPTLNEKISTEFQKLKPLQDAKNWDGMIALLDSLLPIAGPTSYDFAYIQDMRARLLAQQDKWGPSIETMEAAIRVSDANSYFDKTKTLEMLLFLAQVSYQHATTIKVPAEQQKYLAKASDNFKRWLKDTPKATPEISAFYATILLQQAVADPKNVNKDLLKQAKTEVEKLFLTTPKPKEQLYFLLFSILQQEGDIARAAEVLELIVKAFPEKKDYWPQLWAAYLTLASEKNIDEAKARPLFIRAINTVERAQAKGFMTSPKDNFNLVSLYLTTNQLGKATDLLYDGLRKGSIENDPKNWIYLGYYYIQLNRNQDALRVYQEAAKLFPNNGQFDLQIGEIHRQDEKMKEARHHYKEALRKGGLDRPHVVHTMLASAAYEMEDFDEAMKSIAEAEKLTPEGKKDAYLVRLKEGIQAAITEREIAKQQKEAKAKPAEPAKPEPAKPAAQPKK